MHGHGPWPMPHGSVLGRVIRIGILFGQFATMHAFLFNILEKDEIVLTRQEFFWRSRSHLVENQIKKISNFYPPCPLKWWFKLERSVLFPWSSLFLKWTMSSTWSISWSFGKFLSSKYKFTIFYDWGMPLGIPIGRPQERSSVLSNWARLHTGAFGKKSEF